MNRRTKVTLRALSAIPLTVLLLAYGGSTDLSWPPAALWGLTLGTIMLSYGPRIDRSTVLASYTPSGVLLVCVATGAPALPILVCCLAGLILFAVWRRTHDERRSSV